MDDLNIVELYDIKNNGSNSRTVEKYGQDYLLRKLALQQILWAKIGLLTFLNVHLFLLLVGSICLISAFSKYQVIYENINN